MIHILYTFGYAVAMAVGAPQHADGRLTSRVVALFRSDAVTDLVKKTVSPLRECRVMFTAFVMLLCMSVLFYVEFLKSINCGYNKTKNKRDKAMNKMLSSGSMDATTAKIFVETLDIMKEQHCKKDEKMFSFGSARGGCYSSCCNLLFKVFICFNALCVVAWLLIAIDIILLYKGACMVASECH
jgi:hypothetical protein